MKKLIVNVNNYAMNPYPEYFNRGVEITKPENPPFEIGEVIVITSADGLAIGVVLGWVDISYWHLKSDWAGMVSMDEVRSGTIEDFSIPGIQFVCGLLEECQHMISNTKNYNQT